jgi:outer membrane protein assembly factor BamE (lipoprotein component of BamABCDE complex)
MNMQRFMRPLAVVVASALLASGCALDPLRRLPPGASQDEVRLALGEPWTTWQDKDGALRWSYPTGPMGRHSYVAEFDGAGRLRSVEDVMNDRGFARLETGKSTQQDVQRLFGPPYRVIPFARKGETAWDYRFRDAWTYPAIFSVIFNDRGVVVQTMQQREFYGNERGFH